MNILEYLMYSGLVSAVISVVISLINLKRSSIIKNNLHKEKIISGNTIASETLNTAIFKLSTYVAAIKPDYVVGINTGGTMVGAWVCLATGIHNENFIKCLVTHVDNEYKAECHEKNIRGRVLVIDDILRTGQTFEAATAYLNSNKNITEIYCAALIASIDNDKKSKLKRLDFYSYLTTNDRTYLPWSRRIPRSENSYEARLKLYKQIEKKSIQLIASEVSNVLFSNEEDSKRDKSNGQISLVPSK